MDMSKTRVSLLNPMVEWKDINWRKAERLTFKLLHRIYLASERGDVKAVRKLQKTLINSWSAKCIAVPKVTQDNQGKNTAGVDGVKTLSPEQRIALVNRLKVNGKSRGALRVMIPKPGWDEKRPLGIPTINDRALQGLVKLALEPEWEALFEPNSYGFRPGRSCHDAIEAIFKQISQKAKYVLDADIAKCFDRIDHKALLSKIHTYPTLRRQIKAWLKAGVCMNGELFPTEEGTPQGGVISPLLANIALHGMEERVKQFAETLKGSKRDNRIALSLIRYADDFVITHEDLNVVKKCQEIMQDWLSDMGLELKPSKTKLTHTLAKLEGNVGFEFLGFQVQQHKLGLYRSAKDSRGSRLGFKTLITPSHAKVKLHLAKIGEVIDTQKNAPQAALISKLNPIIRGWSNYYSTVVSSETFSKVDHLMWQMLRAWARSRGKGSINKDKYWRYSNSHTCEVSGFLVLGNRQ
jgi:RNA-directed DNA polymerase